MDKIAVIIPTYNEASKIEETVVRTVVYFQNLGNGVDLFVTDDGSTDATVNLVRNLAKKFENVHLFENEHQGKAAAINAALRSPNLRNPYTLLMDADGATDIAEFPKLARAINESQADVAIGSREGKTAQRYDEPLYRHLLGRAFNRLVKILTGLPYEDTQCGFKLFRTEILEQLAQKSQIMNRKINELSSPLVTAFDVELLVLAKIRRYRVIEVPIKWRHQPTTRVHPLRDSIRMFLDLISIKTNLLTGKYERPET